MVVEEEGKEGEEEEEEVEGEEMKEGVMERFPSFSANLRESFQKRQRRRGDLKKRCHTHKSVCRIDCHTFNHSSKKLGFWIKDIKK